MMRKHKVLRAIDDNVLSKPPMRRLSSDNEYSMEAWERRAVTDSKTPKISNCGGSGTKQQKHSTTKYRSTYRRPPRPTRPIQGGLGCIILEKARKTPKRDRRSGISFLSDRFAQATSRLNPKAGRSPVVVPRKQANTQSPPDASAETGDNNKLESFQNIHQTTKRSLQQRKQEIPGPTVASTSFSTTGMHFQSSLIGNGSTRSIDAGAQRNGSVRSTAGENGTRSLNQFDDAPNSSDDDMNCDSSEDSLMNSSSESSLEEANAVGSKNHFSRCDDSNIEIETRWNLGPGRQQNRTSFQGENAFENHCTPMIATGRRQEHERVLLNGEALESTRGRLSGVTLRNNAPFLKTIRISRLLGATVGTNRFALENLEEDTDVTDMTNTSGEDENPTNTSFGDDSTTDDDDDDDTSNGANSSFDCQYPEKAVHPSTGEIDDDRGVDEPNAARRLDFDIPSPESVDHTSADSSEADFEDEQSYEGWSIDGYTNSPILFTIDKKTFVHPPLPAGWRIKISKTHKRPIYIHPDIGRTFHCPVDLPQNVIYVRTKDGKLEKRFQGDGLVDSGSPRAMESPETSASNSQNFHSGDSVNGASSDGSSLTSGRNTSGSQSSKSSLDSTMRLILGAEKQSVEVLNHSSRNLRNAVALMKEKQETPSTMSDVLQFYERDKPSGPGCSNSLDGRGKDGYNCDVSDSENSMETSSSFSSSAHPSGKGALLQQTSKNGIGGASLSPVAELSRNPGKGDNHHSEVLESSEKYNRSKSGVDDKVDFEKWSMPDVYSIPHNAKNPNEESQVVPGYETWKKGIDGMDDLLDIGYGKHKEFAQNQNTPAAENIEAWLTPNVGTTASAMTVHHASKRNSYGKGTNPKVYESVPPAADGTGPIETNKKISSSFRRDQNNVDYTLASQHDQFEHVDLNPNKENDDHRSNAKKTIGNSSLLPFFDIFQQHLANEERATSPRTGECDRHGTTETFEYGHGLEDLEGESHHSETAWPGDDPFQAESLHTPADENYAMIQNRQGLDSRKLNSNARTTAKKKASAFMPSCDVERSVRTSQEKSATCKPERDKKIGGSGSEAALRSSSPKHDAVVRQSGQRQRNDYERVPANAQPPINENDATPQSVTKTQGTDGMPDAAKGITSGAKSAICKDDSTLEETSNEVSERNDSPVHFDHSFTDASPEPGIFARGVSCLQRTSLGDREVEITDLEAPKTVATSSQEDRTAFSDDESSIGSFAQPHDVKETDENDVGGMEVELESSSSSFFVSVKRRRMSWRVMNPTYPLCSLQRLDEIAEQPKKKRHCSVPKHKKRKGEIPGSRNTALRRSRE